MQNQCGSPKDDGYENCAGIGPLRPSGKKNASIPPGIKSQGHEKCSSQSDHTPAEENVLADLRESPDDPVFIAKNIGYQKSEKGIVPKTTKHSGGGPSEWPFFVVLYQQSGKDIEGNAQKENPEKMAIGWSRIRQSE
jgi:hypothetical protein